MTGLRIRITDQRDPQYGDTGTIVSGEGERLHRVKMDQVDMNGEDHRYLFRKEFELLAAPKEN